MPPNSVWAVHGAGDTCQDTGSIPVMGLMSQDNCRLPGKSKAWGIVRLDHELSIFSIHSASFDIVEFGKKKGLGWPWGDGQPSPPTAKNWSRPVLGLSPRRYRQSPKVRGLPNPNDTLTQLGVCTSVVSRESSRCGGEEPSGPAGANRPQSCGGST